MKLQHARGVRDFSPPQKKVRQYIVSTIRETFERFGYLPLETPIIERMDVLSSKFAGGEEILKEIYTFNDQGKRELALRYDLTVPFARFVGMNKNLKMPFKRYQIGRVFRDGPIKAGRYREFWQCDGDVVGCSTINAEAELVTIAIAVYKALGLQCEAEINSRKILIGILEQAGITEDKQTSMILSLDKVKKIGITGVKKELKEKKFTTKQIKKIFSFVDSNGTNKQKLALLKSKITNEIGKEGIKDIEAVFSLIDTTTILFQPFLARGFAYYTGIIYEFFMKDRKIQSSSIGAGGRYDNMIGSMLGSKQAYPAVGMSFGIDVLSDVLCNKTMQYAADLYIIPIKTFKQSFILANELRKNGLHVDIDLNSRDLSKNLKYANSLDIPFVLIVGEQELQKKKFTLRDMKTGKEQALDVKGIVKKLKK